MWAQGQEATKTDSGQPGAPCTRLVHLKFELTSHDSAGEKKSSTVLTSMSSMYVNHRKGIQ